MAIKLYTAIKVDGKALPIIAEALNTLTRKDIVHESKSLKSVHEIAIDEGVCSDKSKVQVLADFHVSVGDTEYKCDISREQLLYTESKERDKCIKSIKKQAVEKSVGLAFELGRTTNEIDQSKFYNNWEAISLKVIAETEDGFEFSNPHISLIKGGSDLIESAACLTSLFNLNNRYHNNQYDRYYDIINAQEGEIVEAYAVEVVIPGRIPITLSGQICGHDDL